MFESISLFLESYILWMSTGVFLVTVVMIAFNIFKQRERRMMAKRGFRGAIPKIINTPL